MDEIVAIAQYICYFENLSLCIQVKSYARTKRKTEDAWSTTISPRTWLRVLKTENSKKPNADIFRILSKFYEFLEIWHYQNLWFHFFSFFVLFGALIFQVSVVTSSDKIKPRKILPKEFSNFQLVKSIWAIYMRTYQAYSLIINNSLIKLRFDKLPHPNCLPLQASSSHSSLQPRRRKSVNG